MENYPNGLYEFLSAANWDGAEISAIPGDASFRRYFRVSKNGKRAMLMHAPPPHEDPRPFLDVALWLTANEQRAPEIYAKNAAEGWVLTEDFGDARMRDWLDDNPSGELGAYGAAIDALAALHLKPAGPFSPYDMATYLREARLLVEWYCPALGLDVDVAGYDEAWRAALSGMVEERQNPPVTVLRDYHAENIMLLNPNADGTGEQGLIDFQDALIGHRAYDLVSLLQDARRDVSEELETAMIARYLSKTDACAHFAGDYALLGAQRNAKIVGIFTRLWKRDGKERYLSLIPRVWAAMERDLAHEALAPVAAWFAANIPQEIRDGNGAAINGAVAE